MLLVPKVDKGQGHWVEDTTMTATCYSGDEDRTTNRPTPRKQAFLSSTRTNCPKPSLETKKTENVKYTKN